jgi:hypothetical protein
LPPGVHRSPTDAAAIEADKRYRYGRPGVERQDWGDVMQVYDPFGNRIRFCEQRPG